MSSPGGAGVDRGTTPTVRLRGATQRYGKGLGCLESERLTVWACTRELDEVNRFERFQGISRAGLLPAGRP